MHTIEIAKAVRDWLKTFPGRVTADSPGKCWLAAWGAYGGAGSATQFESAVRAEGFSPEQIGARWQIRLPALAVDRTG